MLSIKKDTCMAVSGLSRQAQLVDDEFLRCVAQNGVIHAVFPVLNSSMNFSAKGGPNSASPEWNSIDPVKISVGSPEEKNEIIEQVVIATFSAIAGYPTDKAHIYILNFTEAAINKEGDPQVNRSAWDALRNYVVTKKHGELFVVPMKTDEEAIAARSSGFLCKAGQHYVEGLIAVYQRKAACREAKEEAARKEAEKKAKKDQGLSRKPVTHGWSDGKFDPSLSISSIIKKGHSKSGREPREYVSLKKITSK